MGTFFIVIVVLVGVSIVVYTFRNPGMNVLNIDIPASLADLFESVFGLSKEEMTIFRFDGSCFYLKSPVPFGKIKRLEFVSSFKSVTPDDKFPHTVERERGKGFFVNHKEFVVHKRSMLHKVKFFSESPEIVYVYTDMSERVDVARVIDKINNFLSLASVFDVKGVIDECISLGDREKSVNADLSNADKEIKECQSLIGAADVLIESGVNVDQAEQKRSESISRLEECKRRKEDVSEIIEAVRIQKYRLVSQLKQNMMVRDSAKILGV